MANISEITNIIEGIRAQLDALEATLAGGKVPSASAVAKPKKAASEAQAKWQEEVRQALADMREADWKHPETGQPPKWGDALKEASRRRGNEPKPKPESDSEAKPKPKRTLTQEQKDKMAEGRRKAAAKRKAEKEAAAAASEEEEEEE